MSRNITYFNAYLNQTGIYDVAGGHHNPCKIQESFKWTVLNHYFPEVGITEGSTFLNEVLLFLFLLQEHFGLHFG